MTVCPAANTASVQGQNQAKPSAFWKMMHPKKACLMRRARVLELKNEIKKAQEENKHRDYIWKPSAKYLGRLGRTYQALGRQKDAKRTNNCYLQRLLDGGDNVKDYRGEMNACWLMPDGMGKTAKKLVREGKFSEAAAVFREQAGKYRIISTNNIFSLSNKEFEKSVTKKTVDLEMMYAMSDIAEELDFENTLMRNKRRYAIADIGGERARTAQENADALSGLADEGRSAFWRLARNPGKLAIAVAKELGLSIVCIFSYPFVFGVRAYQKKDNRMDEDGVTGANMTLAGLAVASGLVWMWERILRVPGEPLKDSVEQAIGASLLTLLATLTLPVVGLGELMTKIGFNTWAFIHSVFAFAKGAVALPLYAPARIAQGMRNAFTLAGNKGIEKLGQGFFEDWGIVEKLEKHLR